MHCHLNFHLQVNRLFYTFQEPSYVDDIYNGVLFYYITKFNAFSAPHNYFTKGTQRVDGSRKFVRNYSTESYLKVGRDKVAKYFEGRLFRYK